MGYYDTAQFCVAGHLITQRLGSGSHGQTYCEKCGSPTIHQCLSCKAAIRGYFHVEGVWDLTGSMIPTPAYCLACGKPYPWTEKALLAARSLAEELDELSDADKILLKSSLEDITSEGPMADVAVLRLKKLVKRVSPLAGETIKRVAGSLAAEGVKKMLGM